MAKNQTRVTTMRRKQIFDLYHAGKASKEIVRLSKVPNTTVCSILKQIKSGHFSFKRKESSGRKRKTTTAEDVAIIQAIMMSKIRPSCSRIRKDLNLQHVKVKTIQRRIQELFVGLSRFDEGNVGYQGTKSNTRNTINPSAISSIFKPDITFTGYRSESSDDDDDEVSQQDTGTTTDGDDSDSMDEYNDKNDNYW